MEGISIDIIISSGVLLMLLTLIILIFDTFLTVGIDRRSKKNSIEIDRLKDAQVLHEKKENEQLNELSRSLTKQIDRLDDKNEERINGLENKLFTLLTQGK